MTGERIPDSDLVTQCLEGNRDAFAQIVSRYQSLVCSLAYSATGSLGQSQDLAQETFITAWRHLRLLRERHKLRAWLSGIARCLIGKALRREGREPTFAAEPLESVEDSAAPEPAPVEQAITKEEEAILWRSLERIPAAYREPLILFYREQQSIERVAEALELSEDAVKQRLSRGRKLLQDQVASFVEGALKQSAPGRTFTLAVMAVLPMQFAGIGTASAGVALAKAGATTKGGALLAATTAFAGLFTGFASTYLGYKMSMAGAASESERRFIKRFFAVLSGFVLVPLLVLMLAVWARPLAESHRGLFTGVLIGMLTGWVPGIALFIGWARRRLRQLSNTTPSSISGATDLRTAPAFEYRSKAGLFGLPLVHLRVGASWTNQRKPVKAWIAIADDLAIGVIFAFGGMAIAPLCIGGFAVGGIVFGGFGAGILCYAGFSVGIWAVGGFASGLMAIGGCAAGWNAAVGGVAISHQFAQGGVAVATYANDAMAQAYFNNSAFFRNAYLLVTKWLWPTLLVSLLPSLLIWRATKKKLKQEA